MRGEYFSHPSLSHVPTELPPRARRIRAPNATGGWHTWNYLRVRGEYHWGLHAKMVKPELPPHARRILYTPQTPRLGNGTTSACAENTLQQQAQQGWIGNYLRMRGEYLSGRANKIVGKELPPHARRIRTGPPICKDPCGTTSACAENTDRVGHRFQGSWNYLRMRGEYKPAYHQQA